ncbi:isoprenylcysteine carboxylmethyltransferase family protein [soil metagenome]
MKRIIAFLYGIIAYIIFLVSFLYAIVFVGDFLVPKTINTGTETPFTQALIINLAVLPVFALQHSIMARPGFKKWWMQIIHPAIERSTYVLLSSLALILIYWQWRPMTTVVWEVQNETAIAVLYGVFALGWLIVLLSTFMINHFDLFGLKQVYEYFRNLDPKPIPFKMSFLYGIIRHPLMLGFIIAFWATPVMTVGHLIFSLTTTIYILVAVKFLEERDLRKIHGEQYEKYQKEVPMLIPFT